MQNFHKNPFDIEPEIDEPASDEISARAQTSEPADASPVRTIGCPRSRVPMKLQSLADLETAPETEWLIDGLIESHTVGVLYGPSGSYKSFLTLSMALSIANGVPFANRDVSKGAVIYIAGEGSASGHRKRWQAWNKRYGGDRAAPLRILAAPLNLPERDAVSDLLRKAGDLEDETGERVKLIIVDTLARCFGAGDENSARDMKAFLDACERLRADTGATVLIVAHTGKDEDRKIRGSSALPANVDMIFFVKRPDEWAGYVVARMEKQKDAEQVSPLWFEMKPVELGHGERSLVPVVAAAPDQAANAYGQEIQLTRSRQEVLGIFHAAGATGLTPQEACVAAVKRGIPESTYYNIRKFLLERHLIAEQEGRLVAVQ